MTLFKLASQALSLVVCGNKREQNSDQKQDFFIDDISLNCYPHPVLVLVNCEGQNMQAVQALMSAAPTVCLIENRMSGSGAENEHKKFIASFECIHSGAIDPLGLVKAGAVDVVDTPMYPKQLQKLWQHSVRWRMNKDGHFKNEAVKTVRAMIDYKQSNFKDMYDILSTSEVAEVAEQETRDNDLQWQSPNYFLSSAFENGGPIRDIKALDYFSIETPLGINGPDEQGLRPVNGDSKRCLSYTNPVSANGGKLAEKKLQKGQKLCKAIGSKNAKPKMKMSKIRRVIGAALQSKKGFQQLPIGLTLSYRVLMRDLHGVGLDLRRDYNSHIRLGQMHRKINA